MTDSKSLEAILKSVREQADGSASPAAHLSHLSDASILASYEGIRHQVEADRNVGAAYRLLGDTAKERAELLRAEMVRRGVRFAPIIWP